MIEFTDADGYRWVFNARYIVAIQQKTDVLVFWLEESGNFFEVDMDSEAAASAVVETFKSYLFPR